MTMKKSKKIPKQFRTVCKCRKCNKPMSYDSRDKAMNHMKAFGLCRACVTPKTRRKAV